MWGRNSVIPTSILLLIDIICWLSTFNIRTWDKFFIFVSLLSSFYWFFGVKMFSEQFVGILNYLFLLGSSVEWVPRPDSLGRQWVDINDVVTFKMVCSMISPSEQWMRVPGAGVKCEILELAGGFKLVLMEDHLISNTEVVGNIITVEMETVLDDQDKRR